MAAFGADDDVACNMLITNLKGDSGMRLHREQEIAQ